MFFDFTQTAAVEPLNPRENQFLFRYARLRGWLLLSLLSLVLLMLAGMIWRNLDRFETVRSYVGYSHQIHQLALDLQQILTDYFRTGRERFEPQRLLRLPAELALLARSDQHIAADTPVKLDRVRHLVLEASDLGSSIQEREANLLQALTVTGEMLDAETVQREQLLEDISRSMNVEIVLASATLAAILIFAWVFLRRRILAPLEALRELLMRLAREDFRPIEIDHLDRLLLPVFKSYNDMVRHLAELEEAKRRYAESLEGEVRSATRALLEQQASLARAERLAAVGELSAGIAHELRNPLAGIQLSCANLRNDLDDTDHAERLDLIIGEIKRMGHLLNELLAQGRHTPVPAKEFDLGAVMRELVALARYQISAGIELAVDVSPHLLLRLPECRLRQILLNLILNAAEAIDHPPGRIELRAFLENEAVVITVTDDGPGFQPNMLHGEIRPFVTGRPGGTGLGLAMVQRFVREFGGRLKLSNVSPRGACVCLTFPQRHAE